MLNHKTAAPDSSPADAAGYAQAPGPGGNQRPLPAHIGKYEVTRELGHGAQVRLFHAFDRDTGRPVALKILTELAGRRLVERFRREVAIAANLRSPGMIAVYEMGEHAGLPFAAMQHPGGDTLRHAIQSRRPLTTLRKVRIMWQVAEGLQAAHRGGLAHVGIRPSGIALCGGDSAAIQDFGIVRLDCEEHGEAGRYLAPEELAGCHPPDSLCDIFAFGALYYELLTGTHPFPAGSSGDPAQLRELAPECPETLEQLVYRALDRRRELRYQSLDEVQFDAEPALRELQRVRAAALLPDVSRMMDAQDLDEAQGVLRAVLELDPDNRKAHGLRAALRDALQRRTLGPRLEALWREADKEAAARRFEQAVEILRSALRLDGANADSRNRLERMCALSEESRKSTQLVAGARQSLARQEFDEARGQAAEALERDARNPEAIEVLREIEAAIGRRQAERQARLQVQLGEAWLLLAGGRFAETIALLEALDAEFPEEAQVQELLARARRAGAVAQAIASCQRLRAEGRFEEAIGILNAALAAHGDEPPLEAARRETEDQWREFQAAAAIRPINEEVEWLLRQDRPDLAVEFLREKSAGCSHPDIARRLGEIEATLPEWEKRRFIQDSLNRVAALEALQQWGVALTVIEEALQAYSGSAELLQANQRLRGRLAGQERGRRLSRRLETIAQKIAAHAWPQALSLIETTRSEFPEASGLGPLLAEAQASLRRSECEGVAAEVRQCLSDGEADQAEAVLMKGLESLGEEPALEALREELAADKRYREEWHAAQVLFVRRRFREAEEILVRLAAQGRPDAQALLETVRKARGASEEEHFYKQGREKAQKLIERRQFEQAADLLRNLLSLFPGDPILERDLHSAKGGHGEKRPDSSAAPVETKAALEPAEAEPRRQAPSAAPPPAMFLTAPPRRVSWAFAVPVALVALVSAIAAVWTFSRDGSEAVPAIQLPTAPAAPSQAGAIPDPLPAGAGVSQPEKPAASAAPASATRPPSPKLPAPAQAVSARAAPPMPLPRPADPVISEQPAPPLAAKVEAPVDPPAPPPIEARKPIPETVPDAGPPVGGVVTDAVALHRPAPEMPAFARKHGIYGVVNLEAMLDRRGVVTSVTALNGHPVLAKAATDAVSKWRYQPATLNGRPVEVLVLVRVEFSPSR